jgi:prepilin-type N-terminal cleavage/methylation domain-containing protein
VNRSAYEAFTLVELLVVVAIIAILAALLSPALSGAMAQAKSVTCLVKMKNIGVALDQYSNDHNSKSAPFWSDPGRPATVRPTTRERKTIQTYYGLQSSPILSHHTTIPARLRCDKLGYACSA